MKSTDWSLPEKGDRARARRLAKAREVWVLEAFSMPGVPRTRVPREGVRSWVLSWVRATGRSLPVAPHASLEELSHSELVELDRALVSELEMTLGDRLPAGSAGLESLEDAEPVAPSATPPKPIQREISQLGREIAHAVSPGLEGASAPRMGRQDAKLLATTLETLWHRARPRRDAPSDDPAELRAVTQTEGG